MTFGDEFRPRVGDEVSYRGVPRGRVASVEGNLCWVRYYEAQTYRNARSGSDESATTLPFIWRFPRERKLNSLHDWPTKAGRKVA